MQSRHLTDTARRIALLTAVLTLLFSCTALTGHLLDLNSFKNILSDWLPMKPNTALSFILVSLSLLLALFRLQQRDTGSPVTMRLLLIAGSGFALLTALIALLTLSEYLFNQDFGIDTLIVANGSTPASAKYPFRMAPETALCFVLLCTSLVSSLRSKTNRMMVLISALSCLLLVGLATASLSTYFSPLLGVFGWLGLNVMAGDTATLFILLGTASFLLVCSQKDYSWEIGKAATTGLAIGMVLLMFISLTSIRAQYQVSEINARLSQSEMLYVRSADAFSSVAQHMTQIFSFLLTDDIRFLNASLTLADRARQQLDELNRARAGNPVETWLYIPVETRTLEILDWSKNTVSASRSGHLTGNRSAIINQGNSALSRLSLGFDQLKNEHQHYIGTLERQSAYVRHNAFLTISTGMFFSLILFGIVVLRINALVSERQKAQKQLIESEQQYRTLADSGEALIWTSGTDKLCNYFNKTWLAFTGRKLEQEIGNGWTEGVHPDDFQACLQTYVNAFDQREKFSMDYRLRHHDGSYRWIQDDGCPRYDAEGTFLGYIGYCMDVTERKQASAALQESELRFRKLFWEIPSVAVQGYGPDLTTLYWNKASEALYGYSAEEAIGKSLLDLIIPPGMADHVRRSVAEMMATGRPIPSGELTLKRKDGSPVEVISSHAHVSIPGRTPEMFCVDIDISQRKHAEAELENYRNHLEELVSRRTSELAEAKNAAEAANRAKSSFLANMSHEIRTPMNAIIGLTHILKKESSNDVSLSRLGKINDAAQHLLGIINNILDLSKIEAGRLSFEESNFVLTTVVDSALSMLSERARAKGLHLVKSIHPATPDRLLGDPLRLSQILINLVSNAV
ncbi:MAG: PAS domain S-box protein, partial [Betaproteobacteria bacterium]